MKDNVKYGLIKSYEICNNEVKIKFEYIEVKLTVIKEDIINFFVPLFRKERYSKSVGNLEYSNCKFEVEKTEDLLTIRTNKLMIRVYDNFKVDIYDDFGNILCEDYRNEYAPFVRRNGDYALAERENHELNKDSRYKVFVPKKMEQNMYFYGFGEKTGHLNKKGYHYVNYNTDNPAPHGETFDRLYKSIPFFTVIHENKAFGIFFDNHFETHFDMGKDDPKCYYFAAVDGNLDYYFIYGPKIDNVLKNYTYLTGKMPIPQRWTLGYQQCRWSYGDEKRVMEIAYNFRERNIPCDTIYLDIDYMNGYRVFTWNNKKFKNPSEMIKKLNSMGFKVVTIIDPGVKVDKDYNIYAEGIKNGYFVKDNDGIVYTNEVWPGKAVYPDFLNSNTRKWWAKNQKIMIDTGISGIWNDMNEPASFKGPLPDDVKFDDDGIIIDHKEAHNVYGHLMAKATYEGMKENTNRRPFIVTRACFAGSQKYAAVWTGDNQSIWEHLRMSIPMLMNLGLSGMSFCGTDVGGFGYDCTSELLSRWVQVGAFTPLFRNHSSMGTRDQEPWSFDKETEDINRKYIKLRYKIIPYIYDCMYESSKSGAPLIRPLLFNYQDDTETYEINDEFLCGPNILVAPVLEQGKKARMIYLPQGNSWVDYFTKEEFNGGQYIIKKTPLDICPIFIKSGSTIAVSKYEENFVGEKSNDTLKLLLFLGKNNSENKYIHYNDDGESFKYKDGEYNLYEINIKNTKEIEIDFNILHDKFKNKYKKVEFEIYNLENKRVIYNNEEKEVVENKIIINI